MNKGKLLNYLKSHFDLKESTSGWYRMDNPLSERSLAVGDKCLAVNISYNRVICHRTGFKASITNFLKIYTQKPYRDVSELIESYTEIKFNPNVRNSIDRPQSIDLPEHFYLIGEGAVLEKRAIQYLQSRNLDIDFCIDRSVGYCTKGDWEGRIIFPFMNPQLEYYIGRSFIGSPFRHKYPKFEEVGIGKSDIFYNEEALQGDMIYLVEGMVDALYCGEKGVARGGWQLSEKQKSKLLKCPADIYIIPDYNFYQKALIMAKSLLPHKKVWITKDLENYGGKDIEEVGLNNISFNKVNWLTT